MRIRSIKPEFWTDEALSSVSTEAHLLAAGLLNYVDDEGYFRANPAIVKGAIFPIRFDGDSTIVRRALDELSTIGYVRLGKGSDGSMIGQVVTFRKHQRIDRPTASKLRELVTFDEPSTSARRGLDAKHPLEVEREVGSGGGSGEGDPEICSPLASDLSLAGETPQTDRPDTPPPARPWSRGTMTREQARTVFDLWLKTFGKTDRNVFEGPRENAIRARANEGAKFMEAKLAVIGCYSEGKRDTFSDGRKRIDHPSAIKFTLIFKSDERMRGFIDTAEKSLDKRGMKVSDDGEYIVNKKTGERVAGW